MKIKYIYKVRKKHFIIKANAEKYLTDEIERIKGIIDKKQSKIAQFNKLSKELSQPEARIREKDIPGYGFQDNYFWYDFGCGGRDAVLLEKIKLEDGVKK